MHSDSAWVAGERTIYLWMGPLSGWFGAFCPFVTNKPLCVLLSMMNLCVSRVTEDPRGLVEAMDPKERRWDWDSKIGFGRRKRRREKHEWKNCIVIISYPLGFWHWGICSVQIMNNEIKGRLTFHCLLVVCEAGEWNNRYCVTLLWLYVKLKWVKWVSH